MFKRTVGQALLIAFSLSFTGLALARNPPALVNQQRAASNASEPGAGYRDINGRFGVVAARTPEVMRAAGGYRDIYYRFEHAKQPLTRAASSATTSPWR